MPGKSGARLSIHALYPCLFISALRVRRRRIPPVATGNVRSETGRDRQREIVDGAAGPPEPIMMNAPGNFLLIEREVLPIGLASNATGFKAGTFTVRQREIHPFSRIDHLTAGWFASRG